MGTASGATVVRDGFVANGPVDLDQYPLSGIWQRARGQQTGSLIWVNVRNRSGSVVEALLLFLDMQLCLDS